MQKCAEIVEMCNNAVSHMSRQYDKNKQTCTYKLKSVFCAIYSRGKTVYLSTKIVYSSQQFRINKSKSSVVKVFRIRSAIYSIR